MTEENMNEIIKANDDALDLKRPELDLDKDHFGNYPLTQMKKVTDALKKCEMSMQTWTRHHSNHQWRTQIIGSEYSLTRQLRQVAAELKRKKAAMIENKHKYLQKLQRVMVFEEEAEAETRPEKKKLLLMKAEECRETADLVYEPYMGACKDVLELTELHDSLIEQIKEKYGKCDEEVFEIEEARYWVKRSFAQSMRDIRERGSITKGEQTLIEQIGLDPAVVEKLLKDWLGNQDQEKPNISLAPQENFLDQCAEEYSAASADMMRRKGLPELYLKETLLLEGDTDADL